MRNIKCWFGHKVLEWQESTYTRYHMDGELYKTVQTYLGTCGRCWTPVSKRVRIS